jgi:hypothetical protein
MEVKERPILLQGPMIQATLDDRKTQTRRLRGLEEINKKPGEYWLDSISLEPRKLVMVARFRHISGDSVSVNCPYGKAGDHLWCRETWANVTEDGRPDCFIYKADNGELSQYKIWKPSIHMPRKASRILLKITGIRAERLQDISSPDCRNEGCPPDMLDVPLMWFTGLWDSINGKTYPWDSNPWLWVLEFRVLEAAVGIASAQEVR